MPKKIFWPLTLVIMGLIILAAFLGLLPSEFTSFWPLMLIVVGLGGLLTADRDEWMVDQSSKAKKTASPSSKKSNTRPNTKKISRTASKSKIKSSPSKSTKNASKRTKSSGRKK